MASGSRWSLNKVGNIWIGKTREEKDAAECISGTIQRMSRDFRRDRIPDSVIVGHLSHILKTRYAVQCPENSLKKKLSMSLNCTARFGNHSAGWWKVWTSRLEPAHLSFVSGVCDLLNVFARGEEGGDAPLRWCHPSPSCFLHLRSSVGSFSTLLHNAPNLIFSACS